MKTIFSCVLYFFLAQNSFASDYKLVGTYLLEYSIFKIDVYQISYFKSEESEKLVLDYKMDIAKKYSIEGWKVGLKDKLEIKELEPKIQWLLDHTVDLEKGDTFSIVKTKNQIEIFKNNSLVGQTSDPQIIQLAFEPWLGAKPVSLELKDALTGKGQIN